MTKILLPNWNTLADCIDRLIVCVNKLSWFENAKRQESLKESPDVDLLAFWDRASRNECEMRNLLKREIDRILQEIMSSQSYVCMEDNRTFAGPPRSVVDILESMCYNGPERAREELAAAFEKELKNG